MTCPRRLDYDKIIDNLEQMIKLIEDDSERSDGKAKMNSQHLHSLYWLLDKYKMKRNKLND